MPDAIKLEQIPLRGAMALDAAQPHFLASAFWAEFKSKHGWTPLFFKTNFQQPFLSALARRVKGFSLVYIPMQPQCLATAEHIRALADAVRPFLPRRVLFARFDPPSGFMSLEERAAWKNSFRDSAKTHGVFFAPGDVQPPDTVLLDLSLAEEELLSRMKSKWRYNIGLARKKGVRVRIAARESLERDIDIFYGLYLETARRDKIAIHSRAYYDSLLRDGQQDAAISDSGAARREARLYIAEHENEPIACIVTLFFNKQATYLYGASASVKRNLMAPYLLQWRAITDAKNAGCAEYDFYGIPPDDNETHPMHGLYRFKTGFGGTIIHRPGSIDAPLSPLYPLYRVAEKARIFYYKRVKKSGRAS